MNEGFIVGVGLVLLIGVPLLGGVMLGQLSVWNWLHKRYGIPRDVVLYEWLDQMVWDATVGLPACVNLLRLEQKKEEGCVS